MARVRRERWREGESDGKGSANGEAMLGSSDTMCGNQTTDGERGRRGEGREEEEEERG